MSILPYVVLRQLERYLILLFDYIKYKILKTPTSEKKLGFFVLF